MRKIRIANVKAEALVLIVMGAKSGQMFLLEEETREKIRAAATKNNGVESSFVTEYGNDKIEVVVEVTKYSNEFYKINSVTINGRKVYGSSPWVGEEDKLEIVVEAD